MRVEHHKPNNGFQTMVEEYHEPDSGVAHYTPLLRLASESTI